MARITLTALLIAALSASDARSQFDTTLSVICEGCPFSEWLLEWDEAPGADELVQQGDSLYVRYNDGTGGFGPPQFVTALPTGETLILFEDVDDDGDTDLFTHLDSTVHLLRHEGGTFTTVLLDTVVGIDQYRDHPAWFGPVRAMHVDEDGLKDLALRRNNGNVFTWYRNDGMGGYVKRTETLPVSLIIDAEIVAMDWNNDGLNDLITTTAISQVHGVVILQNNGVWNSAPDTICTAQLSFVMRFWDVADLNNDGVPDLLNPLNMFLSDPDSVFYRRHVETVLNYNDYRRIMDLDCDDRPELFGKAFNVGNAVFQTVQMEGDSLVVRTWEELDPILISNMDHIVADLNADGTADLLFKEVPYPNVYARYNLASVPEVSLTLPFITLPFGAHALLEGGTPAGGTWSGEGVVGDSLFTELVTGWPILITYSYTTEFGCTASAEALVDIVTGRPEGPTPLLMQPYPLPADDVAWLPVSDANTQLHVHDAAGRSVQPTITRHGDRFRIATDQLPAGTYVLSMMANGRPAGHGRLVVVH
ncbi:MAG: VCBS repeat-containing protein [Flavobacteriales bacterium]|nr:VCBS repeat-containing protein [Flavobacteriales bacterium]